jgi:endonuclease/exonuclease/phosphatase family metal-dependent hydrolase
MQLKLVTLNIWDIPFWFALDREARIARLGQYLNKISPDLICLQESFDVKHRDDLYEYLGRDQFHIIEEYDRTRRVLLFKHLDWTGGLVTFSRWPISSSRFIPFRRFVDMDFAEYIARKGILETILTTSEGPLCLLNTHLHAGGLHVDVETNIRRRQMNQIMKVLVARNDMPIILAGDFNENELLKHPVHGPAMERLGVKDAAEDNPEPTMRSDNCYGKRWFRHGNEHRRIDYVFFKSLDLAGLRLQECAVISRLEMPFSDHELIMTTFSTKEFAGNAHDLR